MIQQYFSEHLPRVAELAAELVAIESPSHDVAALDRCAAAIAAAVSSAVHLTPTVVRTGQEQRPHLRVDLGERTDVLLIGHFDTVHRIGTLTQHPVRIEDGCLWGPGALDMKGGVAAMIEIARYINDRHDKANVTLFFNSDEEIGSVGSADVMREIARDARAVLVFDFCDASRLLRNSARGARYINVTVIGKGGHGAYPENTRNPVAALATVITSAVALNDHAKGLIISPTQIQGSDKVNVIPDTAEVLFDIRADTQAQIDSVQRFFDEYEVPGFEVRVETRIAVDPLEQSNGNNAAILAQQAATALDWEPLTFGQGKGTSDANIVARVNGHVLDGFGGWGDGAHSSGREYLDLDALVRFPTLAAAMIERAISRQTSASSPADRV